MIFVYYLYHQARSETQEKSKHELVLWKSLAFTIIGLVGLIIGGDWIVKGAVHIAKTVGLSEAVIGITVVGVGTSLPEVAASAVAAYRGNVGIAIGNALGSNLFNILWVLGLSSLIRPIHYDTALNLDIVIMALVSLLLYLVMFVGKRNQLNLPKGSLFLGLYVAYIVFLLSR